MPGGKTQMLTYTILKGFWWSLQVCASYIFVLTVMLCKAGDKTVVSVVSADVRQNPVGLPCLRSLAAICIHLLPWLETSILRPAVDPLPGTMPFTDSTLFPSALHVWSWEEVAHDIKKQQTFVCWCFWKRMRTQDRRFNKIKIWQVPAKLSYLWPLCQSRILLILIIGEYFNLHMGAKTSCQ